MSNLVSITEQKIQPTDASIQSGFGTAVSVAGDRLAVGAVSYDEETGFTFVFSRTDPAWAQESKLDSPQAGGELFGTSLALQGDDLAVCSDLFGNINGRQGSVYLYRYGPGGWTLDTRLVGCAENGFLTRLSLALQNDRLILGNPSHPSDIMDMTEFGTVEEYARWQVGWVRKTAMTSGFSTPDLYGVSLCLDGDVLAVGGALDPLGSGAVHIYRWDGSYWNLEDLVTEDKQGATGSFGQQVALDGENLLIGSWAEDTEQGAAYVFRRGDAFWEKQARLIADDGAAEDAFGEQVALVGDFAAVSAPSHSEGLGAVYLFQRQGGTWSQIAKLMAGDGSRDDTFGNTLDMQASDDGRGVEVVVGAAMDPSVAASGSVYLYKVVVSATLVTLLYFKATQSKDKVTLDWATASEPDSLGFHIWRREGPNGEYVKISQALIPTEGNISFGADYSYVDHEAKPGQSYSYRLEDISSSGASLFHGPAVAE